MSAASGFRACADVAPEVMAPRLYKKAGECFIEACNFCSAAECYAAALDFTTAARLYRKAGLFNEAVALIKPSGGKPSLVDEKVGNEIIQVAKLIYVRQNDFPSVFNSLCQAGGVLTSYAGRWPLFLKEISISNWSLWSFMDSKELRSHYTSGVAIFVRQGSSTSDLGNSNLQPSVSYSQRGQKFGSVRFHRFWKAYNGEPLAQSSQMNQFAFFTSWTRSPKKISLMTIRSWFARSQ
jgi:hypothetical protein